MLIFYQVNTTTNIGEQCQMLLITAALLPILTVVFSSQYQLIVFLLIRYLFIAMKIFKSVKSDVH